jgi:exopolyphosphatase / guanosine-5'-triphosphate,3'-diphosphate pyrophosphatase
MSNRTLYLHIADHTTQFVVASPDDDKPRLYEIPVGCVQLSSDEFANDPPRAEELSNAIAMVQNGMDDVLRELPEVTQCHRAVGIGRTTRIVAAVELGVPESDPEVEGFVLTRDAAEDVYRTLATEALADRRHNPGLPFEMAPVIVGGCCILVAVMRRLYLPELVLEHVTGAVDGVLRGAL